MDQILKAGTIRQYKNGEFIWRPQVETNCLFIIVTGLVKSYTLTTDEIENVHVIYRKGEIFPVAWLIGKQPLGLYFVAVGDCEVACVPQKEVEALLKKYPDSMFSMMQQIIRQFTVYVARLNNLEYKFARERVAYRLLLLAKRFGEEGKSGVRLPRFSQQEIARSINVSRENVSRELKRFERLGFIKYTAKEIFILDQEGLHKQVSSHGDKLFIDDL